MADRKRSTNKRAIREMAAAAQTPDTPEPEPPKSPTAGYSISSKEKAEAAAPFHPRAAKSLGVRNRNLLIEKMTAQAAETRKLASAKDPESLRTGRPPREGAGLVDGSVPQMKTPFNNRKTKSGKVISKPISAGGKPPKKTSSSKSTTNDDRLKQIDADLRFKQSRASEFNKRFK